MGCRTTFTRKGSSTLAPKQPPHNSMCQSFFRSGTSISIVPGETSRGATVTGV